ncbi:MAG: GIY-YIG nuclease family protein [Desulfovibrio sp.]|nr:GIY-YIG nuclease family protein [Desulfovibrio sp.]
MENMKGNLPAFLSAYRKSRNVSQAERASGYKLGATYPPAGFYVYALIDPANQEIFYVGKVIGGRVLKHEERTRRGVLQNAAKVKRIQQIFVAGHEAERRILFVSECEEVALSVEDNIIHELADFGLTNIIGGNAIQNPRVRRVATEIRRKLDEFRQRFAVEW